MRSSQKLASIVRCLPTLPTTAEIGVPLSTKLRSQVVEPPGAVSKKKRKQKRKKERATRIHVSTFLLHLALPCLEHSLPEP